jgi:hypothetical protein
MQRYGNLSRGSGVVAYAIRPDAIEVKFQDGWIYLYTHASAGAANIETMKTLAAAGKGLSTFISRQVRHRYQSKRR